MYRSTFMRLVVATTLLAIAGACAQPPAAPTSAPTEAATEAPTIAPTSTQPPEPTALPGKQVLPVSSLANDLPWLPMQKPGPFSAYYAFNFRQPPFDNLLVRQAFAAAVDKEAVARQALELKMREAVPAMTLTPPSILSRDLYGEMGVAYDPEKAKALLAEAGYADASSFPTTSLLVYMRSSAAPGIHYRIAESVTDMWRDVLGVDVQIEVVENPNAMWELMKSEPKSMYVLGWGADYMDPDNFLKALFHSQSEFNAGHFYSPEFDRYVDQAATPGDAGERLSLYLQAERIVSEREVALIPLFHSLWYTP